MAKKTNKGLFAIVKKHPALFIVGGLAIAAAVYILASNQAQTSPAPSDSTAQGTSSGAGGYYLLTEEDSSAGWQSAYNSLASSLHTKKTHVTVHHKKKETGHSSNNRGPKNRGTNPNVHTSGHVPPQSGSRHTHIYQNNTSSHHNQNPNKLPSKPHVAAPHGPMTNVHGQHHAPLSQTKSGSSQPHNTSRTVKPNPTAGGAHGWVYTTKAGDTLQGLATKSWPISANTVATTNKSGIFAKNAKIGSSINILQYANNKMLLQGKYNRQGQIKPGTKIVL